MRSLTSSALVLAASAVLFLCGPANAGQLLNHPDAYDDGVTEWSGYTDFYGESGGNVLSARVEWAVFAKGKFPFTGYTPTSGEFSYVYEVYPNGTLEVNQFWVNMLDSNEANNIGSFALSDSTDDADTAKWGTSNPDALESAIWTFDGDLLPGDASYGLVYSSINQPISSFGFIMDGGTWGIPQSPMPSPDDEIPEPASVVIIAVGGLFAMARRRRRLN